MIRRRASNKEGCRLGSVIRDTFQYNAKVKALILCDIAIFDIESLFTLTSCVLYTKEFNLTVFSVTRRFRLSSHTMPALDALPSH